MRLLLDTHALIWWFNDAPELSPRARRVIAQADNEIVISAASVSEMSIKSKAGKLQVADLLDRLFQLLSDEGFVQLPISLDHALRAGSLVEHHRDPFDRMLVAQAQADNLPIVSNDAIFNRYGVRRIW